MDELLGFHLCADGLTPLVLSIDSIFSLFNSCFIELLEVVVGVRLVPLLNLPTVDEGKYLVG